MIYLRGHFYVLAAFCSYHIVLGRDFNTRNESEGIEEGSTVFNRLSKLQVFRHPLELSLSL